PDEPEILSSLLTNTRLEFLDNHCHFLDNRAVFVNSNQLALIEPHQSTLEGRTAPHPSRRLHRPTRYCLHQICASPQVQPPLITDCSRGVTRHHAGGLLRGAAGLGRVSLTIFLID